MVDNYARFNTLLKERNFVCLRLQRLATFVFKHRV